MSHLDTRELPPSLPWFAESSSCCSVQCWETLGCLPSEQGRSLYCLGYLDDEAESWYSKTKSSDSWVSKHSARNQWRRQLVQEGIEPRPGPVSLSQLCIGSLNCHSANGCWAALDMLKANPTVQALCLQETRMWPHQFASFKTSAARKGFHCYFQLGKSTGAFLGEELPSGFLDI